MKRHKVKSLFEETTFYVHSSESDLLFLGSEAISRNISQDFFSPIFLVNADYFFPRCPLKIDSINDILQFANENMPL